MDNSLNYIGKNNAPSSYSVEGGLWLVALGAAIADKKFCKELMDVVGPQARNIEVRNMLISLEKGDVSGVHAGSQRLGFPVGKGERCLPNLIKSLKQRAVSKKCLQIANKLEYCARLTPESFVEMLRDSAEEVENSDSKTV